MNLLKGRFRVNEMHQIIKIVGVTPKQLAALHEALEQDAMRSGNEFWTWIGSENVKGRHCFVDLLRSRSIGGFYTVTLKIQIVMRGMLDGRTYGEGGRNAFFFPSIGVLRAIYNALGVYPDEERVEGAK